MTLTSQVRRGLARWFWRRRGLAWQLPSGLHARVESLGEWAIYNEIFVDRTYDEIIELAVTTAPPDRPLVVIDLGAHVGYFSLRVAERVRQAVTARATIAMLEGHPDTFDTLATRWKQQPLDSRTTVRLVRGLAGARAGVAPITTEAFTAASHVGSDGERGTDVPFVDLDTVAPATGPIDLLKCDVEGAEGLVIAEYRGFAVTGAARRVRVSSATGRRGQPVAPACGRGTSPDTRGHHNA